MPKAPKPALAAPVQSKGKGKEAVKKDVKADIDDIFGKAAGGSRDGGVAIQATAAAGVNVGEGKKKKKKKSKEKKEEEEEGIKEKDAGAKDKGKAKLAHQPVDQVQTVIDTSLLPKPQAPAGLAKGTSKGKLKKAVVVDEEELMFRDSRGDGPRRKTEEGYLVYKEDELGIKDEGGDTPLCPFDCDCCF